MKIFADFFKAMMLVPFTILVLIPLFVLSFSAFNVADLGDARFYAAVALFAIGGAFAVSTMVMMAHAGNTVPAPWKVPKTLVITGPYAYVRNPMTLGTFMLLGGEAFLFGSWWLGAWTLGFAAFHQWYFKRIEEPKLASIFGHEYLEYYRNVPRWIPRPTPWKPHILE